ncbi:hypothetical protein NGM99_17155 [Mesorhizobium sp. RP14(2022)]|uniref:Uncharacterized protein n=1 Tax=Mesorhizobium liriopis TaxID=2953882 RepID=A0ABT1CBG8_9HYPH|nr:hypothetical protein [Mesorhizobium liriopis]MCO6051515.1 hypothetical protein [Mesorhizobium liriopis]
MGKWEFNEANPSSVQQELTQRDQFNNDEVSLAEALVREVIQNSADATTNSGSVKVRFSLETLEGVRADNLRNLFDKLEPDFTACSIDTAPLEAAHIRILVIEDFNTKGLTGAVDLLDEENFRNFFRRHGRSGKSGKAGGRWGLGKLVYSSSSLIRTFFGVTVREGDAGPLLMGQAVLSNHVVGSVMREAHGFYHGGRSSAPLKLQMPITDAVEVAKFSALTGVTRTSQTGLSIVIPCLNPAITDEAMREAVINHYYFPLLAGALEVEVGNTLINAETFHTVAATIKKKATDAIPYGFVEAVSQKLSKEPTFVAAKAIGSQEFDETFIPEDQLAALKASYAAGELVDIRVPVKLRAKTGAELTSYVDLYLLMLPEDEKPFALFTRGMITLPGERRYFVGSPAFGAMVARDEAICAFLGDAENPAHTAWNSKAEKLGVNWRGAGSTLTTVRHALKNLYGLIAGQIDAVDENALIDFFSIADHTPSAKGKNKKTPKPKPPKTPVLKAISIKPGKGGFEVKAGPGAAGWTFPRNIRVRCAYDMIGANPFNRHSPFDFDLTKGDLTVSATDAVVEIVKPNVIRISATGKNFSVNVQGFDTNRDVLVDAKAAS